MAGPRWTDAQEAAITVQDTDVLVAAGAGTGKTAVLVERVIRLITRPQDPVDVDRMLVVTFTEAAAGEMRERISNALTKALLDQPDSRHLRQQLSLLPKARITTLHSFCLAVARRYFHRLGLDPTFRMLDPHEGDLLQQDVLDDLLERAMVDPDKRPGFATLLERYGGQAGQGLGRLILTLHRQFAVQPRPEEWLDRLLQPFSGSKPPAVLMEALKEAVGFRLEQAAWNLEQALALAQRPAGPYGYVDNLGREWEELARLSDLARSDVTLEELLDQVAGMSFHRLPPAGADVDEDLKKRVAGLRNKAKDIIKDLVKQFWGRPLEEQLADLAGLAGPMAALVQLVRDFDAEYRAAKSALGALDFNDLERYCLDLLQDDGQAAGDLQPSDLAQALRRQFQAVIVDEYQDINPTQEAILTLVSREAGPEGPPNRFAVGDVKQSIYRFRLAEPGIFLHKYSTYEREPGGLTRRIDLQHNFRSRANVLAAVNYTFRQLFTAPLGELGYDQDAWLRYGGGYPADAPDPAVELHILERDPDMLAQALEGAGGAGANGQEAGDPATAEILDLQADEREALLVARRIQDLMERGRVWDVKAKVMRPVEFRDMAILMRSPRHRANTFVDVLGRFGIPVTADLTTGYFDAVEVATMMALLKVIDNPQQDIPLAAVLHSPLVGLDVNDLVRVRLADRRGSFFDAVTAMAQQDDPLGRRLAAFLRQLDGWRTQARRGRLADLIWSIYQDTGYLDYNGGLPAGEQRRANLLAFHQRAREFDGFARRGLFRFLRFLERLEEEQHDVGTAPDTDAGDAVRLMSIHRSKGLEFPVVFLCDLGRQLNRSDLTQPLLIHRNLGLGPDVVDPELGIRYPSLARHALRHQLEKEMVAEEMRVLYVAMTRAREYLIMVGSARNLPEACTMWSQGASRHDAALPDPYLVSADRPLDWLATAIARHEEAGRPIRRVGDPGLQPVNEELATADLAWQVELWDGKRLRSLTGGAGSGAAVPGAGEPAGEADRRGPEAAGPAPDSMQHDSVDGDDAAASLADGDPAPELTRLLDWESPYLPLANRYAKVRATAVGAPEDRALAAADDTATEEEPAAPWPLPEPPIGSETGYGKPDGETQPEPLAPIPLARPRFLKESTVPTAVELGSAAHLIL
ncbi:MAG TPA: helicase-exonuclease AddAB subunit AddA, partial [Sphingobacteriaceae bacterium]|nr:helicase-exonuclease AddAB subunit AddA [Sphingobacteriaceae bacterium]